MKKNVSACAYNLSRYTFLSTFVIDFLGENVFAKNCQGNIVAENGRGEFGVGSEDRGAARGGRF